MTSGPTTHTMEAMLKNWQDRLVAVERRLARAATGDGITTINDGISIDVVGAGTSLDPMTINLAPSLVTDWNTVLNVGLYYSDVSAANAPVASQSFVGFVSKINVGTLSGRVVQELILPTVTTGNATGIMQKWVRTYNPTGPAWGDWYSTQDAVRLDTVDLNSIVWGGRYIQSLSANATTARNYPSMVSTRAGHLDVSLNLFSTGADFILQTYTEYAPQAGIPGRRVWQRSNYGGTWEPWSLVSGAVSGFASRTSTQSIATGSAYIQMTGLTATETFNMTFASNAFTVVEAGLYFLEGRVVYATNGTGNRTAAVFVNGVGILTGVLLATNSGNSQAVLETGIARLAVGDVVDVRGWQTSGVALNSTSAYLKLARIGP